VSSAFLAGVAAGYGIAVPVGAIAVLIVGLTARTSLRVGAAAGLGAATADGLYALVAVLGGAALAGLIAPAATPLRWGAALVLLGLAAHTAWTAVRRHRDPAVAGDAAPTTPLRAYAGCWA
jgi:threonine/homoserine/homoserine lactone efflux protein